MSASRSKARPKAKAKKPARSAAKSKARKKAARRVPKSTRKAAKRAVPRKAPAAKPPAPKPWTPDLQGLNVVWYNVTDWERAKQFYGGTLGLPVNFALEDAGWIEYGNKELPHFAINRWSEAGPMPTSGGGVATFTCPDVRGAIVRLKEKGVRCDEVNEMPGMVILGTFYDPDGNKLQLAQDLTGQSG